MLKLRKCPEQPKQTPTARAETEERILGRGFMLGRGKSVPKWWLVSPLEVPLHTAEVTAGFHGKLAL